MCPLLGEAVCVHRRKVGYRGQQPMCWAPRHRPTFVSWLFRTLIGLDGYVCLSTLAVAWCVCFPSSPVYLSTIYFGRRAPSWAMKYLYMYQTRASVLQCVVGEWLVLLRCMLDWYCVQVVQQYVFRLFVSDGNGRVLTDECTYTSIGCVARVKVSWLYKPVENYWY